MSKKTPAAVAFVAFVVSVGSLAFAAKGDRFKQLDANGDGQVTKDEYVAFHEKRVMRWFNQKDTNKDGNLSRREFTAMKKKGKAKSKPKATPTTTETPMEKETPEAMEEEDMSAPE